MKRYFQSDRLLCAMALMLLLIAPAFGDEVKPPEPDNFQVMEQFAHLDGGESDIVAIADREKQIIMFSMGLLLLVLLISTAVLGLSMALQGKQLFLPHMICAGLSVTLALVHSVVAVVWFFPFG